MEQVVIRLDDPNLLSKKYKLRRAGAYGQSTEVTLPPQLFERESKRLGLSRDEALNLLHAIWRYGNFRGVYLSFEASEEGT